MNSAPIHDDDGISIVWLQKRLIDHIDRELNKVFWSWDWILVAVYSQFFRMIGSASRES